MPPCSAGGLGRRALSQRLIALGTRLGIDPPEDDSNIETALAYLEQVTGAATQAVAESSADAIRLRRSLDTLPQGVVLCDENGTVVYRNARANALMTSRHGDALAAQAVTELLEDAWHEGAAERTLDLYGPPRRTLAVRAQLIDDGRRPLGVIAMIEDVSERRRLEEIRRDFVANVSHELKTPMGALGLLAETLISEPDVEVAQRLASRIHTEAFRVSRIIDDLLDLSRIESEEAPPREPVLVNLVMAEAVERVRATADQRGHHHRPGRARRRRWPCSATGASWSRPCTPCSRTPSPTPTTSSTVTVSGTVVRGAARGATTASEAMVPVGQSGAVASTAVGTRPTADGRHPAAGASATARPNGTRPGGAADDDTAGRRRRTTSRQRPGRGAGAPSRPTTPSGCRWPTTAWASPPATSTGSSSASTGSTTAAAATPGAPGSGCPSSATWPTTTRGGSTSSHARARARRSPSCSRSTPEHRP